jgi:TolB protein
MKRLRNSYLIPISILALLALIATGSLWVYREWRGQQVAFIGDYHGEQYGLYRLNLLYGGPTLIAPGPIADPRWSPDGGQIAFVSSADEHGRPPYQIAVMAADGKNLRQLTSGEGRRYSPTWSPDGKQIAYVEALNYKGGGPLAIFVMDRDGSHQRQLTPYAYYSELSWSPDGKWIAFSTFEAIYLVSSDGADLRQLTDQFSDSFPVWSPDGAYIAFQSTREDPGQHLDIYVMRADGTEIRRLTDNPDHDRQPSWSPDGEHIIFESNRDSDFFYHVYIMNADGSEQKRLVEIESNSPVWRP